MQKGFVLRPRRMGFPEHLDDVALRIQVSLFPGIKPDYDLVIDFWPGAQLGMLWIGNQDVLNDAWIIRNHIMKHPAALEGAGQGLVGPIQNADDPDGFRGGRTGVPCAVLPAAKSSAVRVDTADNAVAVHGDAGILSVDMVGWASFSPINVIRKEGSRSALAESQGSGDQVGIPGQANPVFLQFDERALAKVLADFLFEAGEILRRYLHFFRQPVD